MSITNEFPQTTHTNLMGFPVFIPKMEEGGDEDDLPEDLRGEGQAGTRAPGSSRQTKLPHCSVVPPPTTCLTAKDQTSFRTTALPSAPVGLAQTSQPLIQGPKLPNTLECGL